MREFWMHYKKTIIIGRVANTFSRLEPIVSQLPLQSWFSSNLLTPVPKKKESSFVSDLLDFFVAA